MRKIFILCFLFLAQFSWAQETSSTPPASEPSASPTESQPQAVTNTTSPTPAVEIKTQKDIRTGFYLQVSPFGFGFTTKSNKSPLLPLEIGGGFDFNNHLSIEASFALGIFWKPYDATTFEGILRGMIYPWGRNAISPFVSLHAGSGSIVDNLIDSKDDLLLLGGDVGATWFIGRRHGIVLRISDSYYVTDYVKGDFNVLYTSLLYRLSI